MPRKKTKAELALEQERRNLGRQAQAAANQRLVAAHRAEYERYYAEEKKARGIGPSEEERLELQRRIEAARERIAKWEKEMGK